MFAVIKTGGKQYRVQEGDVIQVEKLNSDEGQKIRFDQVLLIEQEEKTLIGTPFVEKAEVRAVIVENFRGKKIIVFKKKRRKQYKRKTGHRQELTKVRIEEIVSSLKTAPKEIP
ncbi:50S ribosomal protein L21, partial [Acidobacteriota bacterium]